MTVIFSTEQHFQRFQSAVKKGAINATANETSEHFGFCIAASAPIQDVTPVIRSEKASQEFSSVAVETDAEKEKALGWNLGLFQVSDDVQQGKNRCHNHQDCLMDCTEPCCACQQQFNWHRGSMYRSPRDARCVSALCGHTTTSAGVGYVCIT